MAKVKKRQITEADFQSLMRRKEDYLQEGRNQVLYLMLCIGDENVAHDNWHPERADILYEARKEIVNTLKHPRSNGDGFMNTIFPSSNGRPWPDFENYTYCPG